MSTTVEKFQAGEVNNYVTIKSVTQEILDGAVIAANFATLKLAREKVDNTAGTTETYLLDHHSLLHTLALISIIINCLSGFILLIVIFINAKPGKLKFGIPFLTCIPSYRARYSKEELHYIFTDTIKQAIINEVDGDTTLGVYLRLTSLRRLILSKRVVEQSSTT